jgi:hypothetical protein
VSDERKKLNEDGSSPRLAEPSRGLLTLDQVVYIPQEGYWTDQENKPHIYLWHLCLQLLQIPEARAEAVQCFKRFRLGPGRDWRQLIAQVKPAERASTMKEYHAKMRSIGDELRASFSQFTTDEYVERVARIFSPWAQKWCRGCATMVGTLHNIAVSGAAQEEVFGIRARTRNRLSAKGVQRMVQSIWGQRLEDWEPTADPSERLVEFIALNCGQPLAADWRVILSPKRPRKLKARRRGARVNLRIDNERIQSRTVLRGVWCFARLIVLASEDTPRKELDRLILDEYPLPFEELYKADDQELRRYMKPVLDALEWQPST